MALPRSFPVDPSDPVPKGALRRGALQKLAAFRAVAEAGASGSRAIFRMLFM